MKCAENDIKCKLIERAVKEPVKFSGQDVRDLCDREKISFHEIREMLKRVYNINENILLESSDATVGMMGRLNKRSTAKRQKEYVKRIKDRIRYRPEGKIVVAEGDSWFQFPIYIKDIIDWLNEEQYFAIYSIAYGGDWIANIIYEEEYISELSIHAPDVFMISGGGNDLVGGHRLAIMVDNKGNCRRYNDLSEMDSIEDVSKLDKEEIFNAQQYINEEFYAFINVLKLQYYKMFTNLHKADQFKDMIILTQGYDYPYPRYPHVGTLQFARRAIHWGTGTGKWLIRPLQIKGIPNEAHRAVIKLMIFEVNEMFRWLASEFEKVYHIDCRGVASQEKNWFDELHLESKYYRKVAEAYAEMIRNSHDKAALEQLTQNCVYKVAK